MVRKRKKSRIWRYLIVILIFIFILNILLAFLAPEIEVGEEKEGEIITNINSSLVEMRLPAVDSEGNGVSTELSVETVQGSGRTLVDIENLLFWADTQHSIRMARLVADDFSEVSIEDVDLIYNIKANATLIGGPSAGAAITIATIFALNDQEPGKDVMITGTINHDSSIGPVTSILEKAKASKQAGASVFLVPLLQSRDVVYETTKHCEKFGYTEICHTETIPRKINVSEEAGIEVVEVKDIEEALVYFS